MKIQPLKNITDILENSSLTKLVQRSNEINVLNFKIQQILPVQYRNVYRIINLYDNLLVIEVQNATIRQGFLLQQSMLLDLIQTDFPHITQLELKLNPNFKSV
ncbi:DUF721 domain-containing protein [Ursidibacter maritimus]|uniref:DUF721 domain-containing protein n=1 Tax=Ursidibacter maritimus TaxID=1331689 RepID=A0A949T2L3_9PAST|nr:DciA family protein [Ursidibacter maritimus]KAE9540472.1 hypothetical protein A1D26_01965 [Ursidibacter maritimus]MBV6523562.1 DUF721 domain-containing protein [Ursidibacter maritimus]MBV6525062.1 DUF721 domain-containing protein [Ursidibacter maritimus]MBV6527264.1 DUF721 domain-containing protein [Ursidibacter maritimus]MBV6528676.1 DUF721 domain-containing protein [Ursidibacter maritimus]